MNSEGRIPPLKLLAEQVARVLPAAWRFPICGVSASVAGLDAVQPVSFAKYNAPDPRFLQPIAIQSLQSPWSFFAVTVQSFQE